MVEQIFLSAQMKQNVIISYKVVYRYQPSEDLAS